MKYVSYEISMKYDVSEARRGECDRCMCVCVKEGESEDEGGRVRTMR